MAWSKGSFVASENFWIIAIFMILIFLFAVYLLLNQSFMEYITENINSQQKFCETFEKVPLIGSFRCPS